MNLSLIQNPKITLIKVIAIAFVTVVYAFGGLLLTVGSDRYLLKQFYDKTNKDLEEKSTSRHLGETIAILAIFGILAYIARNLLQQIPFPLDGVYGFKYMNVQEVISGSLILWMLLNYSIVLTNKINIIKKRLSF